WRRDPSRVVVRATELGAAPVRARSAPATPTAHSAAQARGAAPAFGAAFGPASGDSCARAHFAAPLEPSGALGPSERAPAFGASSFGERARVFSTRALRSRGGAPRFRASLCTASRGTSLFCAARGG